MVRSITLRNYVVSDQSTIIESDPCTNGHRTLSESIASATLHSDAGSKMVKFKVLKQQEATTATSSQNQKKRKQSQSTSTSTAGSAQPSRKKTCSDKLKASKTRTQNTKSSKTLVQGSTTNAKGSCFWWTKSCQDASKKLLLPTVIGSVGSALNSSSGYVEEKEPNSWCLIRKHIRQNKSSQRISYPSSMFSAAGITECAGTEKVAVLAQKIRLQPTAAQAKVLRKWMRCARQTYNRALHLVKEKKQKPTKLLKKLVVTAQPTDKGRISTMKDCPAAIRERAVLDLVDAHSAAWKLFMSKKRKRKWQSREKRKKHKKHARLKKLPFNMSYKSRRSTSDSFGFEAKSVKADGLSINLFQSRKALQLINLKMSEPVKVPLKKCVRIAYHCGRWYFIVPYSVETTACTKKRRIIGLDPGARSMFTYFSPDTQEWGDIGNEQEVKPVMKKVFKKRDAIGKAMRSTTHSSRLKKAWYRQVARASNLMRDMHFKIIAWLLSNYDVIICPTFSTANMQNRATTQLHASTRETFRFLSHYSFRTRLLYKAKVAGKIVLDVHEAETTMGCSNCGFKKRDVGSSKLFACNRCKIVRPRDMNSAVDIVLKRAFGKE